MNMDVILIAGPLVRASSWEPTAEKLRDLGWRVQVPDVLAHHSSPPAWSAWSHSLISQIAPANRFVLIGHSSASALAADLATKLPTKAIVIVDGDLPPTEGAAYPVRPALRAFIRNLVGADGYLPVWSEPRWRRGRRTSPWRLHTCARGNRRTDRPAQGSTETDNEHQWLASTSLETIAKRSLSSKAVCRKCMSIGSMRLSSSPDGITFPPDLSKPQSFTTTQQRKRVAAVGPSSTRRALTSTQRCVLPKPQLLSLQSLALLEQRERPARPIW